jgi:hypothetical protein
LKTPNAGGAELALRLATGLDPGQAQHFVTNSGLMVLVTITIHTHAPPRRHRLAGKTLPERNSLPVITVRLKKTPSPSPLGLAWKGP